MLATWLRYGMALVNDLAKYPGTFVGTVDGVESGPCLARLQLTLLPNGGIATRLQLRSPSFGERTDLCLLVGRTWRNLERAKPGNGEASLSGFSTGNQIRHKVATRLRSNQHDQSARLLTWALSDCTCGTMSSTRRQSTCGSIVSSQMSPFGSGWTLAQRRAGSILRKPLVTSHRPASIGALESAAPGSAKPKLRYPNSASET